MHSSIARNGGRTAPATAAIPQASRRSWRIGQQQPVRVKFLVNKGTTQTTCLRLMGKKMLVALMMEGKFSGEGIHSLESDDDLMSAMARELVERGHVGESADAIWADLKRERAQHMNATLKIWSDPGKGTEVVLIVPGRMIFEASQRSTASFFRTLMNRDRRPQSEDDGSEY